MLALLIAMAPLVSGEIFGDVKSGDTYLAAADVELTCGTETVAAKTDSVGSFRIRAKATGKCRFTLKWKDQTPTVDVVVFDRPTRYRIVLETVDGKFVLKRV